MWWFVWVVDGAPRAHVCIALHTNQNYHAERLLKKAEAVLAAELEEEEESEEQAKAAGARGKKGGGGGAGGAKQAEKRLEETKEGIRRTFYRPLAPMAARRVLGERYRAYEEEALGPLFADVQAFEGGGGR